MAPTDWPLHHSALLSGSPPHQLCWQGGSEVNFVRRLPARAVVTAGTSAAAELALGLSAVRAVSVAALVGLRLALAAFGPALGGRFAIDFRPV